MSEPLIDAAGYLLHLVSITEPRETQSWILLTTDDFTPLSAMPDTLGALSDAAVSVAKARGSTVEETSVASLDLIFTPNAEERQKGHVDRLTNYTFADGSADIERLKWHLSLLLDGKPIFDVAPVTGAVARAGESLIGRDNARTAFCDLLQKGPVMLLGPRRAGKTSFLYWLKDEPPPGYATIYLDLERISDAAAFAVELSYEARQHPALATRLSHLPPVPLAATGQIVWRDQRREQVEKDWQHFLKDTLLALEGEPKPLMLLDEFGDFLYQLQDTEALQPLIALLSETVDNGFNGMVITGSRSLSHMLEQSQVQTSFDKFQRFTLPPLDPQDGKRIFLERLRSREVRPSKAVVAKAMEMAGHGVPFYLQMLADAVLSSVRSGDLSDTHIIDDAYHHNLLGHPGQAWFQELEARLKAFNAFRQKRAGQKLLRYIADHEPVEEAALEARYLQLDITQDQLSQLMVLLEEYFFIVKQDSKYSFQTPVLRDYTKRYYQP